MCHSCLDQMAFKFPNVSPDQQVLALSSSKALNEARFADLLTDYYGKLMGSMHLYVCPICYESAESDQT